MVRISLLYPNRAGARFDLDYYLNRHLPLVVDRLGHVLKDISVDEGMSAGSQGERPPFRVVCHFLAESAQAYQDALAPHRKVLAEDIPRFTDLEPLIQYSRIHVPKL